MLRRAGESKDILLDALAEGCTLKEAARRAEVASGTHYHWLKADPAYAAAYEFALQIRSDRMEEAAEIRAIHGYDEVTTIENSDGTSSVKTHHKYSDALLVLLLKAGNKDKFSDRAKLEVTGAVTVADTLSAARARLASAKETDGSQED